MRECALRLILRLMCSRIFQKRIEIMKFVKGIKFALYWLVQCTWGFLQTFLGFCYFLRYAHCKHEFYHGAVLTYHDGNWGGVSMGAFIFVNGNRPDFWQKDARIHEYGHTVQSLLSGPLYLFVVGIPSTIWCNGKKFRQMRAEGKANYYDLYCERDANTLGAWATKEEKPKRENSTEELRRRGVLN